MEWIRRWLWWPNSFRQYDFTLVCCAVLLSAAGVYLIERVEPGMETRQMIGIALGLCLMAMLSLVNYRQLGQLGWGLYLTALGLLFAVNIMGAISGGAARWLEIGSFRFQPSELGKFLLILFFSQWFSDRQESVSRLRFIFITAVLMGIPLISILEEPDLSTTVVTAWIFICMWFTAGLDYRVIARLLAALLPVMGGMLFLITRPGQTILNEYQYRRIMAWLDPGSWAAESYQQTYSAMAIGAGGLMGRLGESGEAVTVISSGFLPEVHTDFIMAAAGQELGFVGCGVIILLQGMIVLRCIWQGLRAKNMTGRLLCTGMAAWIGGQAFVNLGVVSGMLPNTGLTFPFVSYGLTSMVSLYLGLGVALNVGIISSPIS